MPKSLPTVALVNDTSLYEHHFGCQLVCQTFREQFARVGLELRVSLPYQFDLDEVRWRLAAVDLVVVNGEGTLHHQRGEHLVRLAAEFPAALVNTVYQDNCDWPELAAFRYRSARESLSAAEIRRTGAQCDVTPDLLFASQTLRSFVASEPTEEIGITDNVTKRKTGFGPFKRSFGFSPYVASVAQYLNKLCSYRRVCAGRFHAAAACAVLGIPFSTWESNTWKTRGLMHDMGAAELHFGSFEEAMANVPQRPSDKISEFAAEAVGRIEGMFDRLETIAAQLRNEGRRQQAISA